MTTLATTVCPSCGGYEAIVELTGWCLRCSRGHQPDLCVCESCNQTFTGRGIKRHCSACERNLWLAQNADRIELFMIAGLTFDLAVARVKFENQPRCLSCGALIYKGAKGKQRFCRTNAQCRKVARSYKWFREYYNLTKEEALERALNRKRVA